jgi:hypothetical protein
MQYHSTYFWVMLVTSLLRTEVGKLDRRRTAVANAVVAGVLYAVEVVPTALDGARGTAVVAGTEVGFQPLWP